MFGRLKNLVVGFLSLFIRGLEVSHPEALLEAERERLRKGVALYNQNLARQAGFIERLKAQSATLRKQVTELTAATTANLKAGNRDLAANLALDLRRVNEQLEENARQEKDAEGMYQNYLRQRDIVIREAREKIEALSRQISQVELMEAQAELSKLATATPMGIGDAGDSLKRVEEGLQERYEQAAGTVRVAKDSVLGEDLKMKDAERKALAEQALAEFAANMGLSAELGEQPAAPVEKTMGPGQKTV
jgi:phage shock protein A